MLGTAVILSEPIYDLGEKISEMLAFCGPCFLKKEIPYFIHEEKTLACGCNFEAAFATNTEKTILCFFCGKLYRKEEIEIIEPQKLNDSSCVLKAYEQWGEECFRHLDGDFSLIIYDMKRKELLAARDRLGIYPLYWYEDSHAFLAATSIKALLRTGIMSPTPDSAQLAAYFSLGYISQEATAIQDINRLLPGYYLKRSLDGRLKIAPFWSFSSKFATKDFIEIDFSTEIYREMSRRIDTAISDRSKHLTQTPSLVASEMGSYIIWHSLRAKLRPDTAMRKNYLYTPAQKKDPSELTANDFLESLVPLVWAQETPNANISSPREFYFSKACFADGSIPFFDTGFSQEYHLYAMEGFKSKKVVTPLVNLMYRLLFLVSKKEALHLLRKTQEAKPQVAFFEQAALLQASEKKRAIPLISKFYDTNIFIHQFYNLDRLPTLNASLFYLAMKTELIDSVVESRLRVCQGFGLESHNPFLDTKFIEFLAALHPQVWASPDILPSFPVQWLQDHHATLPTLYLPMKPQTPTVWLKAKETRALFKALKSGILVESGYVSLSWLKAIAKKRPQLFMQKLYAIAVLEVWMRLFIDIPIRESSRDGSIFDLLSIQKAKG